MIQTKDLLDYLKKCGYAIKNVTLVDSLNDGFEKITHSSKSLPNIRLPLINGITGVRLQKCNVCSKTFANETALTNHLKANHLDAQGQLMYDVENASDEVEMGDDFDGDDSNQLIGSQYQIVDSSFIADNSDDVSYLIVKIDPTVTTHNSGPLTASRRPRRPETKPRKRYEMKVKARLKTTEEVLQGPYKCVDCSNEYDACCDYSQHFYKEHTKRKKPQTRCQICEKRFDQELHPELGIFLYPDEEVYMQDVRFFNCEICSMQFQNAEELESHKATHFKVSPAKPFECTICCKSFSNGNSLSHHMKTHTGVRPYICPTCNKGFAQKGGLDQHVRIHSQTRPFICAVCHKCFRQSAHLSQHMRTHSRIHPFYCKVCHRRFKQASNLNSHMRTHEDPEQALAQNVVLVGEEPME